MSLLLDALNQAQNQRADQDGSDAAAADTPASLEPTNESTESLELELADDTDAEASTEPSPDLTSEISPEPNSIKNPELKARDEEIADTEESSVENANDQAHNTPLQTPAANVASAAQINSAEAANDQQSQQAIADETISIAPETLTPQPADIRNNAALLMKLRAAQLRKRNMSLAVTAAVAVICVAASWYWYTTQQAPLFDSAAPLSMQNSGFIQLPGDTSIESADTPISGEVTRKDRLVADTKKLATELQQQTAAKVKSTAKTLSTSAPTPSKETTTPSYQSQVRNTQATATDKPASRIRVKRRRLDQSGLTMAWQQLQAGNYQRAEALYKKVLVTNAKQIDALSGLSAIAQARGDHAAARQTLLQILRLDPHNSYAQASLLSNTDAKQKGRRESDLKTLEQQHPGQAEIPFILGNHYAALQRWPEAQAAYFRAFEKNSADPDYAYNLAIAMDHIGKQEVAVRYYNKALTLADQTPARFKREQLLARLAQLD
ncbi:MAG: tetratricopeptide repeat protein [Pseudomonadales bacterium]